MSGNAEHSQFAFQTVETGLHISFKDASTITADPELKDNISVQYFRVTDGVPFPCGDTACDGEGATTTLVTQTWHRGISRVPPAGYSLDGGISTHHFTIRSDARHGKAQTRVIQGFSLIGPSETP